MGQNHIGSDCSDLACLYRRVFGEARPLRPNIFRLLVCKETFPSNYQYESAMTTQSIGQVLIGAFFLVTLAKNLSMWRTNVGMVGEVLPFPAVALAIGFLVEFVGAVMLTFDYNARVGAIALISFTVVATALFLRFWTEKDPVRQNYHAILFFNNFAIVGGLLLIV